MVSSKKTVHHYVWGQNCDGWPLVDRDNLSVKQEKMPPGTYEVRHFHSKSIQYFFVLQGQLKIEIKGEVFALAEQQGIEIEAGKPHQVMNDSLDAVEFLVISQPNTKGDRIEELKEN